MLLFTHNAGWKESQGMKVLGLALSCLNFVLNSIQYPPLAAMSLTFDIYLVLVLHLDGQSSIEKYISEKHLSIPLLT